jgi:hypothetical protein
MLWAFELVVLYIQAQYLPPVQSAEGMISLSCTSFLYDTFSITYSEIPSKARSEATDTQMSKQDSV